MSVTHNVGISAHDCAAANGAAVFAEDPDDVFLEQVPVGTFDPAREWTGVSWSGWEQWPHPLMEQPAHGRAVCECPRPAGYMRWEADKCRLKFVALGLPDIEVAPGFQNDLYGAFDPHRYSVFAVRAYLFPCAYHDGEKYILPSEFSVLRFSKTAAGLPSEFPYKTCSWNFPSSGFWELVGTGAPGDETVRRDLWPQRLFDLMAGPETGPMTNHDSFGQEWDQKGSDRCNGDLPLYLANGYALNRNFSAPSGITTDCLRGNVESETLGRVIPAFARHTLAVVCRIWKRRTRTGQKDLAAWCAGDHSGGFEGRPKIDPPPSYTTTPANTELQIYADIGHPLGE